MPQGEVCERHSQGGLTRNRLLRILAIVVVVGISVSIYAFRDQLKDFAAYGYPGVFLIALLGSATVVFPAPSLALVFAAGSVLVPPLVGLAAGIGDALGELTGYLAGFSGRGIIEDSDRYRQLVRWMTRHGGITIFVLSVVPNPVFDIAGMTAGALKYPLWRFLLFCWVGKTIKTTAVAYAGAMSIDFIKRFLF